MTINSKATSNKPDYRPDLLPQSHLIRNLIFLILIVFVLLICGFAIWNLKQTKNAKTEAKKIITQQINLPKTTNKTINNKNKIFKCTDQNGNVIYQNACPSNSKSEAIEIHQISGVHAYKPMTDNNSYSKSSSSAAIFDREKEACKKRVQEKIKNLKKNRSFSKSELKLLEKYEQELRNCPS